MEQMAKKFTYRIRWSEEDEEFVATVAEFPSLSWLDADQVAALEGIGRLVERTIVDLASRNEPVPVPFACRSYSGNIRLRMPPEQHRDLAIRAEEEGVSLNRYLCSLISAVPRVELDHVTVANDEQVARAEAELERRSLPQSPLNT